MCWYKTWKKEISISGTLLKKTPNTHGGCKIHSIGRSLQQKEDYSKLAIIPYIHGTYENISNVLKSKQIKIVFHPPNSLRNILDKEKDRINPMQKKGVYLVPFSCKDVYIGESVRSIQIRLKEHCADIKHERKKSALAEHS